MGDKDMEGLSLCIVVNSRLGSERLNDPSVCGDLLYSYKVFIVHK